MVEDEDLSIAVSRAFQSPIEITIILRSTEETIPDYTKSSPNVSIPSPIKPGPRSSPGAASVPEPTQHVAPPPVAVHMFLNPGVLFRANGNEIHAYYC